MTGNTRRFSQVQHGSWPSGRDKAIAILRDGPSELAARFGLTFANGRDDLDAFVEAGVVLASGRRILLSRYDHEPSEGTVVHVDSNDDTLAALTECRAVLGLTAADFFWIAESP